MPYRKIHTISAPGCGKTYIASKLQELTDLKAYDLDKVFWDQNENTYVRSSEASRTEKLNQVLSQENWIIKCVYYKWLINSFDDTDLIIILNPPVLIKQWRIFKCFLIRKFIQGHFRKESLSSFLEMYWWNQKFDNDNMHRILEFTREHKDKKVYCKSYDEVIHALMPKL